MHKNPRVVLGFPSQESLAEACSFDRGRALIRAPWEGRPLVMGSAIRLQIDLGVEPPMPAAVLDARTGPGGAGVQWFLLHGEAATILAGMAEVPSARPFDRNQRSEPPRGRAEEIRTAASGGPPAGGAQLPPQCPPSPPGESGLEVVAQTRRVAPRWQCKIPALLEMNGARERASIIDISDTGVKLEELSQVPRAGAVMRVQVEGTPGEGLLFRGRVAWANSDAASAGLRFVPAQRDEARQVSDWVAAVQVSTLSELMGGRFVQ